MSYSDGIKRVIELVLNSADWEAIDKGKERQSAIWENREPDYLPLLLTDWETPELQNFPHYTLKEQFYCKEKMLFEQMKGLVSIGKTHSDAQLSVRVNMGVGILPSIFGLQAVFPQDEQMPWFIGHLSKEEILKFEMPTDIRSYGLMPRVVEYLEYFKSSLLTGIKIYCFDTQGPFDIAHLIRGHEIYTDLYDDPKFVHSLLDIATTIYIEATKIFKQIVGEPLTSGYHGTLYIKSGGVRLCDDSSVNLSPTLFKEFSLPYIKKALAPFGGGWVHFCGDANHLLDMYLELEEIKGLNFGNPEKYDYPKIIEKILSKGKFYVGYIPRMQGEKLKDYFVRILAPLKGRKGLILQMTREEASSNEILDLWRSSQDEML